MTLGGRCGSRGGRCWRAAILAAAGIAMGPAVHAWRGLAAQSRLWAPEERAVVTDFSSIEAVAASPFTMFAATAHGLVLYDRTVQRWRLPVTPLNGYPTSVVRTALADVVDDAVWLGLDDGYARYDAAAARWEHFPLAGAVSDFIIDADNPAAGVWALVGGRWVSISRYGPAGFGAASLPPPNRRIEPLSVAEALNQAPMADAMRALLLTDPRLRQHRFTAAARSSDRPELYFGTDGAGIVRVDPQSGAWDALSYGLPGPGAGAVALAPNGVWVASEGDPHSRPGSASGSGGLIWLADDLSTTDERGGRRGATAGGMLLDVRALVASGTALWLATSQGLDRIDPASLQNRGAALVDDVLALAAAPGGVWAGTRYGVTRVGAEGVDRVTGPTALALWRFRDTLWVGTAAGIAVLPPDARAVAPLDGAGLPPVPGPVIAFAQRGDTLVAGTPDQLAWRDPVSGGWTMLRPAAPIGRITHLALDRGGVWVGGTGGLAHWTIATSRFVAIRVPGDLPAGVRDIAASPTYVWVATDEGVVRLARAALLGP